MQSSMRLLVPAKKRGTSNTYLPYLRHLHRYEMGFDEIWKDVGIQPEVLRGANDACDGTKPMAGSHSAST